MHKHSSTKIDDSIFYYMIHGYIGLVNANTKLSES